MSVSLGNSFASDPSNINVFFPVAVSKCIMCAITVLRQFNSSLKRGLPIMVPRHCSISKTLLYVINSLGL